MAEEFVDALNRDCYCISVDRGVLRSNLEAHLKRSGLPEQLLDVNSNLFAGSPVFLGHDHLREMERLIGAVEKVAHLDTYRKTVLASAPVPTRRSS